MQNVTPIPAKNPPKPRKNYIKVRHKAKKGYTTCNLRYGCGRQKPNEEFGKYASGALKKTCLVCESK